MFGKSNRKVGDIIEPLLDEERFAERKVLARITVPPQIKSSAVASPVPPAPETSSSIRSGLSIVGKIVGQGKLAIFGHVEGEVHASTVQIGDGAQVEGDIVAEELTIGGRVKGTIHANRVKLNSTAVVEGDIYHRSLAIEENAQFEGTSRRQENAVDIPSLVPAKLPHAQAGSINVRAQGIGASESRKLRIKIPRRSHEWLHAPLRRGE
jgi:cytoskeletal protein CcmA (bactofilin family)